jgi:hypothetical protein
VTWCGLVEFVVGFVADEVKILAQKIQGAVIR